MRKGMGHAAVSATLILPTVPVGPYRTSCHRLMSFRLGGKPLLNNINIECSILQYIKILGYFYQFMLFKV